MYDQLMPHISSFCELLYNSLNEQFPEFLRDHWRDRVTLANQAMTTGVELTPEQSNTLIRETEYIKARAAIANLYLELDAQLKDADDDTALIIAGGAIRQGYLIAEDLAGENFILLKVFTDQLESLQEMLAPKTPEVVAEVKPDA